MCVCVRLRKYSIKVGDRVACAWDVVTHVYGSVYRFQITREGNVLLLMLKGTQLFVYYKLLPQLGYRLSTASDWSIQTTGVTLPSSVLSCKQHTRTFKGFKLVHTEELCSLSLLFSLSLSFPPPFQFLAYSSNSLSFASNQTYYCAESLSWYSLDLLKHSCTPWSSHNLFIADSRPGENGSVSACLAVTPNRSMASS